MNRRHSDLKEFSFFCDEAYHDIAITQKNGVQNINIDNASEYFIVAIVGIIKEKESKFLEKVVTIENKYKRINGIRDIDEFKGTSIRIKNYKHGFATMKKDYLNFYTELFEILIDFSAIIQISSINKFEYVMHEVFRKNYCLLESLGFDERAFIYSFIKFLNKHKTKKFISLIHSNESKTEEINQEIRTIIECVKMKYSGYKLKESELKFAAILESILKINNINFELYTQQTYEWNYKWSLDGLKKLKDSLEIDDYQTYLYLDGKGRRTEKIYQAAKKVFPNADINRCESKENVGVRVADFISNMIGRLIKVMDLECITKQITAESKQNINEMILLDEEWFNLNENAFKCYKTVGRFFERLTSIYWTTQVGVYADIPVAVYRLFQYISEYKSYEDFKKITLGMHTILFNYRVVNKLKSMYEENI